MEKNSLSNPSQIVDQSSKSDSYEEQLRILFLSCICDEESTTLDGNAIRSLCHKLELSEFQIDNIIERLPSEESINFDTFRDVLVSYLEEIQKCTQLNGMNQDKYSEDMDKEEASLNDDKELIDSKETTLIDRDTSFRNSISSLDTNRLSKTNYDSSEEEYLRSIWAKLGVGQDGFLDRNELSIVCQCIGMEKLPDEVVDQLFLKLDLDNDGRVAFNDLLSIFQSSKAFWNSSHSPSPTTRQITSNESTTRIGEAKSSTPRIRRCASPIGSETGTCSYDVLLEYWDTIGIVNGQAILKDLGLLTSYSSTPGSNHSCNRIDLYYLSALLESEMEQFKDAITFSTAKAAITTVQREARFVRSGLDNVRFERDKLRADLNDANHRATLLAQEIDDQNARLETNSRLQMEQLESRYSGEIKEIQNLLSKEREQNQNLVREFELKDKCLHEKLLEQEGKLKEEISLLLSENERLERENLALGVKLNESDNIASSLQKEIQSLTELKERLLELENQRRVNWKVLSFVIIHQFSTSSTVSESIGAEILGCPTNLNRHRRRRKGSSSFESIEDHFLINQDQDSGGSSDEGYIVSSLKKRVRDLENKCKRQSQNSENQYTSKLEELIKNYENELSCLKKSNLKLMNDKSNLEEIQLRTNSINITLTKEMEKVESEMSNVQNRLHVAIGTLDVCKGKQSNDEERINILTAKCSKLEDRLRESLSLPPSSISGPPSSSASSENIQIISIRNNVQSDSVTTSPSPSIRGSASPNVSKIFLNSADSRLEDDFSSANCSPVSKRPLRRSSDIILEIAIQVKSVAIIVLQTTQLSARGPLLRNEQRSKVQVFQLEQHCKNLEGELDHVKDEILKILSAKSSANKENESLKRYALAYESLARENQTLKKEVNELKKITMNGPSSPLPSHQTVHDRSSPDGQEYYDSPNSPTVSSSENDNGTRQGEQPPNDLLKFLEVQKTELETEKNGFLNKISELEESLELMKNEFENMEDYWQEKLDKERSFYENQLSLSDSNFKELEIKMKEYEELMMTTDGIANHDSDKLSTIAESVSLECQVTELEEELSDIRSRLREIESQKNQEITDLSQAWKEKFQAENKNFVKEKEIYEEKIRQMEKTLEDVSSNLTKATSERINEKERYDRDINVLQDSCSQMQEQIRRSKSVSPVPPASKLRLLDNSSDKNSRQSSSRNCINQNCCQHNSSTPSPPAWLIQPPATGIPRYCNHSGSMSLDASFRFSDHTNSSHNKLNGPHLSDDVVDSVARAYQTMVRDISNEKNSISKELENLKVRASNKKDPVAASVARIWKSPQYKKILKATQDQHQEAIKNLENLMTANENVLRTHAIKYGEQIARLTQSELLVKSLVAENDSLVSAFQSLSKNHLMNSNNSFINSNNKFNLINPSLWP
ncbi:NINL [Lepeophtheirus salmonis]|uniref:NINL n=1 Tax=Lepeophtheirus salmonis TaxID=72036 RepID=A0A7R8CNE7_LEPSM|nr:NINL [Lepeophtheirus salmonis]CAF2872574.1 NINL [Lepeophtheirus salmonis]